MILEKLVLDNCLSIGHAELELGTSGITSIIGINNDTEAAESNGAGKTAILDGLMWVMYGQTMRGLDAMSSRPGMDWTGNVDKSVQNIFTDGKLKGVLTFRKGKTQYKIERMANSTRLWRGKKEQSKSKKETEAMISELFPPIGLFSVMVYIGSRGPYKFSKWNSRTRTEAIESLIDLGLYEQAHEGARTKLKELQTDIDDVMDDHSDCETKIEVQEGKVEQIKETLDDLSGRLEEFEDQAAKKNKEIGRLELELDALSKDADTDHLEKELKKLKAELEKQKKLRSQLTSGIAVAEADVRRLEKEMKAFKKLGTKCPTCKQDISKEFKDELVQAKQDEIDKAGENLPKSEKKEEELGELVENLNTQVGNSRELITEVDNSRKMRVRIQQQIDTLNSASAEGQEQLQDSIDKQIADLKAIQKKMRVLHKKKKAFEEEVAELEDQKAYYGFWETGYSSKGIRSYKLDTTVQWLNDQIEIYTDKLFGSDMVVEIATQKTLKGGEARNSIELNVDYDGRGFSLLSDSERARVDFALHLALRDMAEEFSGEHFNILFLDEVFQALDAVAVTYAQVLLQEFARTIAVYLASHKEGMREFGDSKIIVEKTNDVSVLSVQ